MKLAEALIRIKDLKGKAAELNRVVYTDTVFERIDAEEEIPSIEDSLEEFVSVSGEIASLKSRIARTNASNGAADKIHEMESLRSVVSKLEDLSHNKQSRTILKSVTYGDPPVKITTHATYDVEAWTNRLKEFRSRIREIDVALQTLNWEVELVA